MRKREELLRKFGRVPSLLLVLFLLNAPAVFAQNHFELTPSITVGEEYDDNIYLDPEDEVSDFITTVSPAITLSLLSAHTNLDLTYSPSLVRYAKEDENDTVRQSGSFSFGRDLSERWRLDMADSFLRSEEPLEEAQAFQGVVPEGARRTRNPYWRNLGEVSLSYTFARESVLTTGYRNSLLENKDETVADGMIQSPFARVNYWFNMQDGVELDGEYTKADFSGDAPEAEDDYTGYSLSPRYIRRFSPNTSAFIGYSFIDRTFKSGSDEPDYSVHQATVGIEHAYSPEFSVALNGGYFLQKAEDDDQDGYTYGVTLTKRFERGIFTLGGSGGWEENFLAEQPTGFTRYWRGEARVEHQLYQPLSWYAGGFYRLNKEDEENRQWSTWAGNLGMRWSFMRWFSLSLDYLHTEQDDDMDTEDYKDNRVMLFLTASKLYRW